MRPVIAALSTGLLICLLHSQGAAAEPAPSRDSLQACAQLADAAERLQCFDRLAESASSNEATAKTAPQPAPAATPAPSEPTMTGQPAATAAAAPPSPKAAEPRADRDTMVAGRITSCKQGHYGHWFFIFDNGEIWRESNKRNLRFKDCDFDATVRRDGFGYKLTIEGRDKSIRVTQRY